MPERILIGTKSCGHVEVAGGLETVKLTELRDWLERGLTLRMIPLEEFREKHQATMLCDCHEGGVDG